MSNETHIQGHQNVVIQSVTGSTITVNIDGQLQEVERKLDVVLALLNSLQAGSIQTADKIYNIGAITHANFEMIVGQSALNLSLPADLAHNLIAGDDRWVQSLRQELLKQPGVSVDHDPIKVFQHYGWLIGTFLRKLNTPVGRERSRRRLAFMAEAYQSSLRYLCYAQVSQIFQYPIQTPNSAIAEFIALDTDTQSRYDYLNLLLLSTEWIDREGAFMPEIHDFTKELQDPHTDLYGATLFLEKHRRELLTGKTPQGDALETLLNEYLTALVFWLRKLAFLARYRLVSIKEISLNYRLGTAKNFVHQYGELHALYIKDTLIADVNYKEQSIEDLFTYNQSVLLFRGISVADCLMKIHDPGSYISLSPLVVDESVFKDATQTPEIFYFIGIDGEKRQYRFVHYNQELKFEGHETYTYDPIEVGAQNNKFPRLDELYEQLQKVFHPFKSPAK
jgi:hypothetical protein